MEDKKTKITHYTVYVHRHERREGINRDNGERFHHSLPKCLYWPIRLEQRSPLMGASETVRVALGMYAGLHSHCSNEGDGGQSSWFCTVNSQ